MAAPEALYPVARVGEAERRPAFLAARGPRRRRAARAGAAMPRRRDEALEAIRTAPAELPRLSPPEPADRADRHRNPRDARRATRSWGHRPSPASAESASPGEPARRRVEYLRDSPAQLTLLLEALPPGRGRTEGRRLLTGRIVGAIAAARPALAAECRRQRAAALTG
ncbi:hypothetical protein [Streptomyces specialis]|uniref:hypothetical protein n=1 Tax=Streptomyces specialis TaxID=498367 RepID=UPI00073EDD17|nr:hypothetical protein [Streptomyces specialis]